VAKRDCFMSLPEVKRGIVPALISTLIVPQLGVFRSRQAMLTGESLTAEELQRLGVLSRVVDDDQQLETVTQEFVTRIGKGMERLSAKHREILVLRNIKNMSYEEIAAILGISVGTVKSRIARARESLRSKLGEDFK